MLPEHRWDVACIVVANAAQLSENNEPEADIENEVGDCDSDKASDRAADHVNDDEASDRADSDADSVESDTDSVLGRECDQETVTFSDDEYQRWLAEEARGSDTNSLPTDTYSDSDSEIEHGVMVL